MESVPLPHDHGDETAILERLGTGGNFQIAAEVFKQLGDATRIRIFWLLCHCEECVVNISAMLDMSSPAVSHHLQILKEAGLLKMRREGTRNYYYFDADAQAMNGLLQMLTHAKSIMEQLPDRSGGEA